MSPAKSQAFGRTHHLLLSAYARRWREIYLAMFTVYLDDSGTDPNQQIANASALIIPAARLNLLESEWKRLKAKYRFSEFHTAVMVARNPKSDFANLKDREHENLFRHVLEICMKYGIFSISFTIKKSDYDEVVPCELRQYMGKHHYTWAVKRVLAHLLNWQKKHPNCPLEYVFSWMGEKRKNPRRAEIEDAVDQAEADSPGKFSNWSFRRPIEIPGLQCVDLMAWSTYQYGLFAYNKGESLHPFASVAWKTFMKHNGGRWGYFTWITRDNLERWVDKAIELRRKVKQ